MKRKLRKSLSWLLTFAMVISLFCGMIPTASAADDGPEVTGNGAYNGLDTNLVYFHIGTTDIYKMAMLKDPSVTAETDIDSVKINFKNSGSSRQLASSNPADKKTDFAYWQGAKFFDVIETASRIPKAAGRLWSYHLIQENFRSSCSTMSPMTPSSQWH